VRTRLLAAPLVIGLLGLAACTTGGPADDPTSSASVQPSAAPGSRPTSAAPSSSAASRPATASGSASASTTVSTVAEPTTTNTLPPPPRPSKPAPKTAGALSKSSLPVPSGWRTVVRKGGSEEGYEGNGTWVHARDPRYAAQDVITLGCAAVTRDDYPDPTAALEGTYAKAKGESGIGLVLQFATPQRAAAFFSVYRKQVKACTGDDAPVQAKIVGSALGLIDHRSYPDGDWTEVGRLVGSRLTLIILSDPGHKITRGESEALLRQVGTG
jgi:hypothetical protein